jgi:pimeloyl-ACP methyl ester carboxylesterase
LQDTDATGVYALKWLILRGLVREIRHWGDFQPLLEKATSGVLALDLPGVGTEHKRTAPLTTRGTTEDIRERFLEKRGAATDDEWGILGISLGGMIALDWVYRYPYDFKKIVVINSSSKDTGPVWQRLTAFGMYQMAKIVAANKSGYLREKECMKMVSNIHQGNEEMIRHFVEIREECPVVPATAVKQLAAAAQFMLPPKIKIPALILASLKDNMVDVRCSKLMAERLNAQIKFHPTAGHDLPLDDAQWVVDCITEFERTTHGSETLPPRGPETSSH